MALSTELLQYLNKPSGVYRITKNKSQINIPGLQPTTPLVVGFSKKGILNSPVFCADAEYFSSVFGKLDRTLERKGSWFHRTALELLTLGPVIVLNLYVLKGETPEDLESTSLTDDQFDITEFLSFSTGGNKTNYSKRNQVYNRFFNTDKFWFPDPNKLNDFSELGGNDTALFNFVNLHQTPVTVLNRKSDVTGFDVSANEWFGLDEVPEFMNGSDYISDFFIDTIILKGDFTDYAKLSIDPIFGSYFDLDGVKKDTLAEFLKLPQITVAGIYTGCLIPDFIDKNNQNLYIETLINQDTSRTGVLCSVNQNMMETNVSGTLIDLIGHNSLQISDVDFLSYKTPITRYETVHNLAPTDTNSFMSLSGTDNSIITLTVPSSGTSNAYADLYSKVNANLVFRHTSMKVNITDGTIFENNLELNVREASIIGTNAVIEFLPVTWTNYGLNSSSIAIDIASPYLTYTIVPADVSSAFSINAIDNKPYLTFNNSTTNSLANISLLIAGEYITTASGDSFNVDLTDGTNFSNSYSLIIDSIEHNTTSGDIIIKFALPDWNALGLNSSLTVIDTVSAVASFEYRVNNYSLSAGTSLFTTLIADNTVTGLNSNEIVVNEITKKEGFIKVGGFILSEIGLNSKFTRITSIIDYNGKYKIIAEGPIVNLDGLSFYHEGIDEHATHYNLHSLTGFSIKDRMIPNNTHSRMKEIYNVLESTNLYNTLIDKRAITFRYLVDTFNHGLESNSKNILTRLCRDRENAFAIINSPTMEDFRESKNPIFTSIPTNDNPKPSLDTKYIIDGGNLQNNPTFRFSLPTEVQGASFGAFYAPNVLVRERGKIISVPPAAYVARNFISKHVFFKPWSIVAGEKRGMLSGTNVSGVAYPFDDRDRGYLENFGINTIVLSNGGLMITSNSTALQTVKSSLSQINGTEVLIYLQDRVAKILKKYVWENNDPEIRLEVKTILDDELEQIKIDGGIYDYINQMNNQNNDSDVIDSLLGIVDTGIEITKGMAKVIHRTSIFSTGQIATGVVF